MLLKDFVGQIKAKQNIELLIGAAKKGRELPHIGLYGPAGCGKTTLAEIISNELNAELIYINGAAIISPVIFRMPIAKAIIAKGTNKKFIVMVDECHAIPKKIQNNLLSVLEKPAILCTPVERKIKLPNGQFLQRGQILKEKLPDNISFIFCTTDKGQLSDALESRLHQIYLDDYSLKEKQEVVHKNLLKHNLLLEDSDIELVASTAKTMRHLVKICDRIVDYSIGQSSMVVNHNDVVSIMNILGIDRWGCDINDRKYLDYVKQHGPVSLSSISRYLNIKDSEVKEKIEPFLIRNEWVHITQKGRIITNLGLSELYNESKSIIDFDEIQDIV